MPHQEAVLDPQPAATKGDGPHPTDAYLEIEALISEAEESAIPARWKCGTALLMERDANGGKQLPNGRIFELAELLGVSQRELHYRMKFADRYRTGEEVCTVVRTFRSWTAIRDSLVESEQREAKRKETVAKAKAKAASKTMGTRTIQDAPTDWISDLEDLVDYAKIGPLPDTEEETLFRVESLSKSLRNMAKEMDKMLAATCNDAMETGQVSLVG